MQQLLHCIDVDDVEIAAQLNPQQVVRVIHACGVLYITEMNGLVKIIVGRQYARKELVDAAPPCLTMELINTPVVNFMSLVGDHKDRLCS